MDQEKQLAHIATVVDLMSQDQAEFKQEIRSGINDIKNDVRALKDGRLREFDIHAVETKAQLRELEKDRIPKASFERIEKIVYSACAVIILEAIAILFKYVKP